ncbi:MAG TPA: SRPBCC family protein [Thermoplasmata archaeon]|nr:SRPBCC family protein [Thermoplasmata archaeon]
MTALIVRTRRRFPQAPADVWPLLLNSRMAPSRSLWFRLGVPQPVECRVPDGRGGVGSERECVSIQGVVHQRILEWTPPSHLVFRLEWTDLAQARGVGGMRETFDLDPVDGATVVTRTTEVELRGAGNPFRRFVLWVGLKQVHRFVFRNWLRLSSRGGPSHSGPPPVSVPPMVTRRN